MSTTAYHIRADTVHILTLGAVGTLGRIQGVQGVRTPFQPKVSFL
jgi:hypothetical protein